jgi:hypothetical protein
MLHDVGLDAEGIEAAIRERLSALRPSRRGAVSQL